ncbi:high affinity cationic amino acid transporter 1-like [Liolophura sinensis]|uniref:high affinity cationic amino acid transporter 1-like n=1 Tax=Liolophura sinensis TaxID=3198878 RepID=UPI003158A3D2
MERIKRLWNQMMRKKRLTGDIMETPLMRCLGTCELMLFGLGHMMGAGIYVVTGSVVSNIAGPATVVSYAIAGFAAFLSAICYAEFAAMVPKAGSAYAYTYVTIGEFWAFVIGWNIILEHLISVASVGRAWSATFMTLISSGNTSFVEPEVEIDQWLVVKPDFIGAIAIAVITVFLVIGAKTSAGVNNFLTLTNGAVILVVAIGGFCFADLSVWDKEGFMPYGVKGTIGGAAVCFYAFIGFEGITIAGEEARDPARSMPKAIMGAMAIATIAYVTATLALTLMVPYYEVDSAAAFPVAFGDKDVGWLKYIVTGGSLFGITASMLGSAFALSRSIYALSNDGVFFKFFAKVNSKTQTPVVAILVFNLFAAVLASLFEVEVLIEFMAIGTLLAYSIVAANIVVIRYSPADEGDISTGPEIPGQDLQEFVKVCESENIINSDKEKAVVKLKPMFENLPGLRSVKSGRAVIYSLVAMVVLLIVTSSVVAFGAEYIQERNCWVITLVVILAIGIALSLFVISAHQQNNATTTFQVPFVPVIPMASIFINVTLMMQLSTFTWLRLLVWQTIGFLIYFGYGRANSNENIPLSAESEVKYDGKAICDIRASNSNLLQDDGALNMMTANSARCQTTQHDDSKLSMMSDDSA